MAVGVGRRRAELRARAHGRNHADESRNDVPDQSPIFAKIAGEPLDIDDDVRCRECWLTASIPARWSTLGGMTCVVVPVQVVETWLLCVRGDEFPREPERAFDRRALKTRFFGKPMPPVSTRIEMAIELLSAPHAMGALRKRPSYLRFEKRAVAWKSAR